MLYVSVHTSCIMKMYTIHVEVLICSSYTIWYYFGCPSPFSDTKSIFTTFETILHASADKYFCMLLRQHSRFMMIMHDLVILPLHTLPQCSCPRIKHCNVTVSKMRELACKLYIGRKYRDCIKGNETIKFGTQTYYEIST